MLDARSVVGAGVFAAGVTAAVLAGAGTAAAAAETDGPSGTAPSTSRDDSSETAGPAQRDRNPGARLLKSRAARDSTTPTDTRRSSVAATSARKDEVVRNDEAARNNEPAARLAEAVRATRTTVRDAARELPDGVRDVRRAVRDTTGFPGVKAETGLPGAKIDRFAKAAGKITPETKDAATPGTPAPTRTDRATGAPDVPVATTAVKRLAAPTAAAAILSPDRPADDPTEPIHDVLRAVGNLLLNPERQDRPGPLSVVGDLLFDTLATLERIVGGDPVVPPELRNSVEVGTSTLEIAPGREVEANWYFPVTEEGAAPPDRLIYLQHGFLAVGPLYSYTASYLATSTNSVVVTPTLTSNPFEAGGMWLGGNAMHESVAQLFLDPERQNLNASMHAAADQAGREIDSVPLEFVLVGHSLGGGFAPGVAGYYAEGLLRRRESGGTNSSGAPNHLAGVVIYDAVPIGSIMPEAMDRLDDLEKDTGTRDDYVPVYEIGAPLNLLNVFSDVNDQLSTARPDSFTGVVLVDGVHMDPMLGGNPLIQVAAYLIAGFPQPQNPPAVWDLSAGWIDDMFENRIDPDSGVCDATDCKGQYPGEGATSFPISTARGEATAVLIGTERARAMTSLQSISLTDFVSAIPAGVLNGLQTSCDLVFAGSCPV